MGSVDFTTALGKLLSDGEMRRVFAQDRRGTAQRMGVSADDFEAVVSLDNQALERQANALLKKRLSEVRELLPLTFRMIDDPGVLFLNFAEAKWPTGHRRHAQDAVHFCRYLIAKKIKICRSEYNRLAFGLEGKRLAIHAVGDIPTSRGFRFGLQILYRRHQRETAHFAIYC